MIVAGFGFRGAATVDSLRDALERAGAASGTGPVDALAAPEDKAGADCLRMLAQILARPILPISPEALQAVQTLTQARRVQAARGVGSVAEAAALAAAGPAARLLAARAISGDGLATAALAEGGAA